VERVEFGHFDFDEFVPVVMCKNNFYPWDKIAQLQMSMLIVCKETK
jgi:hypothetical protein